MGSTSKVLLVLLRLGELVCGAVVFGVLEPEGRLIYTIVVAFLTIINSLVFIFPFAYLYWSFPLDFIFVLWIVAFGLFESLTGIHTCSSSWFNNYWGYYWGRWYVISPPGSNINWTGCNAWRTGLGFSFIASMIYLTNGVVRTLEYGSIRARSRGFFERKRGLGGSTNSTAGGPSHDPSPLSRG
ncbi:hypothetical protein QBC36DRAFT_371211 [Triangularia setosa]|uniref:MARVEL domain-containing protein n=1 Tax=Triangularia setosa TaxID=2587417 RepID=A0AAN6VWE6_9PEZI|nr:hypothetical protein QBC36DRAFT_371211 [Podospora setosa]